MLIARNRRARIIGKANAARAVIDAQHRSTAIDRLRSSVQHREATNMASHVLQESSLEDRLSALEKEDQIERLLEDLKNRQPRLP